MKIALISPRLSTTERYGQALGKVGPTCEPLGLAYLAASIKKFRKGQVEIIDTNALNYSIEDLKAHLSKSKPDVIGISILTPMYLRAKEAINAARQVLRDSIIIVGGPHVTIFPIKTLEENPEVDIAVIGEGELTIVELLSAIGKNKSLSKIKGIAYRKGKKVIVNAPRPFIIDIDKVPLPARNLLPMEKYRPAPTYYKRLPSYLILTSRGCPFNCAYCSKIFGKTYRHHSVGRVMKEMEILINGYGARDIIFRDDTFTINKKYVIELCNEIIRKGLNKKVEWTCMTRVNLVDKELLNFMRKAGCWSIHYGAESGSQRLLGLINKGITIKQVKDAFRWTREAGIEIKAFFMLGLPTETREESLQTLKFAKGCGADWIQVTITVPYPGTRLYEIAKKDGTLKSFNWEDYQTWAGWSDKELVYVPQGRESKELKALQTKAMRDFYFTPRFVFSQVKKLRSFGEFKVFFNGAYALLLSKLRN